MTETTATYEPGSDPDLVFVDVETTGLDPSRHAVWEVALLNDLGDVLAHFGVRHDEQREWVTVRPLDALAGMFGGTMDGTVARWRPAVDARALEVGDYDGRIDGLVCPGEAGVAAIVDHYTAGAHLVGANPAFDAAFLTAMLRRHGLTPRWHHRLIDIEAVALGWAHGVDTIVEGGSASPRWHWIPNEVEELEYYPRSLSTIARILDVPIIEGQRHTAVGDAQTTLDCWDRLTGDDGHYTSMRAQNTAVA